MKPSAHDGQPKVAISILNWNGWEDTIECLESVRKLDYPNYLTVVVDNGSWNGSADKIKAWAEANLGSGGVVADYTRETALAGGDPEIEQALDRTPSPARLVLIRSKENLGFTGGNNVSIHYALQRCQAASYVMTLNNDAIVAGDCLSQLVSVAQRSGAGIVGAEVSLGPSSQERSRVPLRTVRRCLFRFLPFITRELPRPRTDGDFIWTRSSSGCAAIISREVLQDIFLSRGEYMSSRLFMYFDEFELHFQAEKHGHRAALATKTFVVHKSGKGPSPDNPRVCYYFERNTVIMANQVLPFHLWVLFHLLNIPHLALRVAKWYLKGQRSMAKVILSGQIDGYRGVGGKWKHHDWGMLRNKVRER